MPEVYILAVLAGRRGRIRHRGRLLRRCWRPAGRAERPWRLAAIHAGDWLIKLVAVGAIVAVWQ